MIQVKMPPYSLVQFIKDFHRSVRSNVILTTFSWTFRGLANILKVECFETSSHRFINKNEFNELWFSSMHSVFIFCILNIAKYLFHTLFYNIYAKQLTVELPRKPTKKHAFFTHCNSDAYGAHSDHVKSIFCHFRNISLLLKSVFHAFPSVNCFKTAQ